MENSVSDQKKPNAKSSGKLSELDISLQALSEMLDKKSLEDIIELKIKRFLDQIGTYYPENLYSMIIKKAEKPLIHQILLRTGGNQVHAARILGINRNTLRKKMKIYDL